MLAAAGGLLVAARLLGSVELAGLAAAAAAAVAASLFLVGRAPLTYRGERWLAPMEVGVGDAAEARLRFTNIGSRPTAGTIVARDPLGPAGSGPAGGGPDGGGPGGGPAGRGAARCLLAPLLPGAMAEATYDLPTERRGVFPVGPLAVGVSDPFGLSERRVEVAGVARLVVHPRVHAVLAMPGSSTREARHGSTHPVRSPFGDDFFALREYEVGDDLRRVHWRSTARTGDLMLRQDEVRTGSVATVLLDTRAEAHSGDSFERALEVAASVAAALVEDGRRLRFLTTGGFDVELGGARAAGPGQAKWAAVLEHLAVVAPDGARTGAVPPTPPGGAGTGVADPLALAVQSIRHHPSGPLVAVVGDATPAELAALGRPSLPPGPGSHRPLPTRGRWAERGDPPGGGRRGCLRRRPQRLSGGLEPGGALERTASGGGSMSTYQRQGALAVVSAVTAAGCCRLFADAGWVWPVLAAVAGAHAVGAITDRWSVRAAVATHGAVLGLLLVIGVGGHTAYGLPTPASLAALGRAAAGAPEALRAAIVPAPTTPELVGLVVAGLWIATATADGLARRRPAGLLAVLPLAVFPVVVAALGTARLRAPLTFAFAAATALYAVLDRSASLPPAARPLRPARLLPRGRSGGSTDVGSGRAGRPARRCGRTRPGRRAGGGGSRTGDARRWPGGRRRPRLRGDARRVPRRAQPAGRHPAAAAHGPPRRSSSRSGRWRRPTGG